MVTTRKKPETPAQVPAVADSSPHRLSWNRDRLLAIDERAMIDEQIASAARINAHSKSEADEIYETRVFYADKARNREHEDADKILTATTEALHLRQAELDRVISGLDAALNASGKNRSDGFQSE